MTPHRTLVLVLCLSGCQGPSDTAEVSEELGGHHAAVFPPHARVFGRSLAGWGEAWWQWIFSVPTERNPMFDDTGEDCDENQRGPVWFLAGTVAAGTQTLHRSCTIPFGRTIMVSPSAFINDFPCPDPNFHPPPGVSLYDWLIEGANAVEDSLIAMEVTLDGVSVADPFDFRAESRNLFLIDGHPSLATSLDGCITGSPQPAVVDGYFLLLKPPRPGRHTLVVRGVNPNNDTTIVWDLTIGRRHH